MTYLCRTGVHEAIRMATLRLGLLMGFAVKYNNNHNHTGSVCSNL